MTAATETKFQIGRTYSTRSICDINCVYSYEILSRTQATVTISIEGNEVKRKVAVREGVETFYPMGKYSMAPVIRAA
jgi:hypothetical protein